VGINRHRNFGRLKCEPAGTSLSDHIAIERAEENIHGRQHPMALVPRELLNATGTRRVISRYPDLLGRCVSKNPYCVSSVRMALWRARHCHWGVENAPSCADCCPCLRGNASACHVCTAGCGVRLVRIRWMWLRSLRIFVLSSRVPVPAVLLPSGIRLSRLLCPTGVGLARLGLARLGLARRAALVASFETIGVRIRYGESRRRRAPIRWR
jgi:hypothetical protein